MTFENNAWTHDMKLNVY